MERSEDNRTEVRTGKRRSYRHPICILYIIKEILKERRETYQQFRTEHDGCNGVFNRFISGEWDLLRA